MSRIRRHPSRFSGKGSSRRQVSVLDVGCGYGGLTGRFRGVEIMNSGLEHHSSGRAYFRAGNPHEAL